MSFPHWLYQFTPRDEQVTPLELLIRRVDVTEANASPQVTLFTVPGGRLLFVTGIFVQLDPGAGQIALSSRAWFQEPNSTREFFFFGRNYRQSIADEDIRSSAEFGSILIPSDGSVVAQGIFNSAVAANSLIAVLHGIIIPRGNFAL